MMMSTDLGGKHDHDFGEGVVSKDRDLGKIKTDIVTMHTRSSV